MALEKYLIESIEKMIVCGNRLELPKTEQFSNYAKVKQCLIKAGGKYHKNGFDFNSDAQLVKDTLTGGVKIDDKKKFQFFGTPKDLAKTLVSMAGVTNNCRTLEPEAGQGAIANILKETAKEVVVVELWKENAEILRNIGYEVNESSFLDLSTTDLGTFDKIVANPPFSKNQDIDHIKHMFSFLNPGGTLVSISSKSWQTGSMKKQIAFRNWLKEVNAEITEIPAGSFKESGTNVSSVIIKISI